MHAMDSEKRMCFKLSLWLPFTNFSQVNENRIIFTAPVSQFTPDPFPLSEDLTLIAPFWADVDARGTGTIWHREANDHQESGASRRLTLYRSEVAHWAMHIRLCAPLFWVHMSQMKPLHPSFIRTHKKKQHKTDSWYDSDSSWPPLAPTDQHFPMCANDKHNLFSLCWWRDPVDYWGCFWRLGRYFSASRVQCWWWCSLFHHS